MPLVKAIVLASHPWHLSNALTLCYQGPVLYDVWVAVRSRNVSGDIHFLNFDSPALFALLPQGSGEGELHVFDLTEVVRSLLDQKTGLQRGFRYGAPMSSIKAYVRAWTHIVMGRLNRREYSSPWSVGRPDDLAH
ncbi:hypothetical protein B0H12DRAFT_602319 [Mycena haematopus]|nr:hypothetical protein B0H12DRAFT_602319 [Mycena haematopus]